MEKRTVTVWLPVSKSDPRGKGACRTLPCKCVGARNWSCPFHALLEAVHSQCNAMGFGSRRNLPVGVYPLFGQRVAVADFVSKERVIEELQRHSELVRQYVKEASELVPSEVTGHCCRRSGIKFLARSGCSFQSIQWLARHSSQVTWSYIEEAWGENNSDALRLQSELSISQAVTTTLARVAKVEDAVNILGQELGEKLAHDGFSLDSDEFRIAVRNEARRSLFPPKILNLHTRVVHVNSITSQTYVDPKLWTTKCGWNWVLAEGCCQPLYEEETYPEDCKICRKCE